MNEFKLNCETSGARLDKFISDSNIDLSRSAAVNLIENGAVLVNGLIVSKKYKLSQGDVVVVNVPDPMPYEAKAENIPLDIIYEDDDIIVVNKPKGMVVHPAAGHYSGTLVNALMYHCKDNLSGINGVSRPGIVHRIDMNTTGVLVTCKNDFAHSRIAAQLAVHDITRKYNAIVWNPFSVESGTVDAPLARSRKDRKKVAIDQSGRRAVTHYRVLENFKQFAHVECQLETGRTHQIRVHMASIMHPLLGDELYGPKPQKMFEKLQGQTLHAKILGFQHPVTNQYIEVESPLPQYFVELLKNLGNS